MMWDVFISHAGEDKETVARPLAERLQARGLTVWFDAHTLTVGDNLRQCIDDGLANSRFGIVILSKSFFQKEWPQKELEGLVAREDGSQKVILPIWHELTRAEVARYSPILAGKVAARSSDGFDAVVSAILASIDKATGLAVRSPNPPQSAAVAPISIERRNQRILELLRENGGGFFVEAWMKSRVYGQALRYCEIPASASLLGVLDVRGFFLFLPIRKYAVFGDDSLTCYSQGKIQSVRYSEFASDDFRTMSHSRSTGRQTIRWTEVRFGDRLLFDSGDDDRIDALMSMLRSVRGFMKSIAQ